MTHQEKKIRVYTHENPYTYHLRQNIVGLKKITLRRALIYNSNYIINDTNNTFSYDSSTITLDNGNYKSSELVTMLSNKLSGILTGSVTYDDKTYKLSFTTSSSITINFSKMPQLARILGFNEEDKTGTNFTSDKPIMLNHPFYTVHTDLRNNDENPYYAYDIIPNIFPQGSLLSYYRDAQEEDEVVYNTNNTNMTKIKIEIRDSFNYSVDFNNIKYMLEFDLSYEPYGHQ